MILKILEHKIILVKQEEKSDINILSNECYTVLVRVLTNCELTTG
jgi:hypothetical protein